MKRLRFIWKCHWSNNASDWRDSETCRAEARNAYSSREEAEKAGARHRCRSGNSNFVQIHDLFARPKKKGQRR